MAKIPLELIKKIPHKTLSRILDKMKNYLKTDPIVLKLLSEHNLDPSEIDLIPMTFADLDVSARTQNGIIYFNYKLLQDGDFLKDYSYGIHECTHWFQQCYENGPTKSSNNDSYLDNEYEQKAFQNQVKYISDHESKSDAKDYVNKVLDHHDINNKSERSERMKNLMKLVDK